MSDAPSTAVRLLVAARHRMQRRGYNAFSYADLAADVGVKPASIHYHFPSKAELAAATMRAYTADFDGFLRQARHDSRPGSERIKAYAEVYNRAMQGGTCLCLGTILLAEKATLPVAVTDELDRFVGVNLDWLEEELCGAADRRQARCRLDALAVFAAVQGAQLVAYSTGEHAAFEAAVRPWVDGADDSSRG